MSKADGFETSLLQLLFTATTIAGVASGIAGAYYLSLHFADPGEGGNQASSETNYGGYARQSVQRTTAGFTITGSSVALTASVTFPQSTNTASTITHFGLGTVSQGSTTLFYSGTVTPNVTINTNVTPALTTGTNITED